LRDKPKVMAKQKTGGKEDKVAAPVASAKAKKKAAAKKKSAKSAAVKQVSAKKKAAAKKLLEQKKKADAELDPFEVAKQTMKGSVPAIVETMVRKAKQGSCTHAKTLLEMTGAKHMFGEDAEIADSGEPWAKLVLERMDEAEQESLTQKRTEVAGEP
jgi:hypothetical protein